MKTADVIKLDLNRYSSTPPKVAIVGAGCGEVELLTLKAARYISKADVIIYDSLVCEEILTLASSRCAMHFVGKRCGQPSAKQDEINALLVASARGGGFVVRLKGGDPNIFGRGCEEALYLAESGIKSEFVPGVTAALGCAASAGIPLTHRGVARSVTFVTGRVFDNSAQSWSALLCAETSLVFYMGKEQAGNIAKGLLAAGASIELPMAFITNGARVDQDVVYAKLGSMAMVAQRLVVEGPTLIIVGEVVNVAQTLSELVLSIEERGSQRVSEHSDNQMNPSRLVR
ncbi:uroporphyrinogen-III C-methyltransferase [Shewanella woodyi]|uniref:uroporphyrinogen-III C-methyltransferase n=1 Tax=Shewanella woodyi (strain ATCC 51908 / MS32) TaxID=392500 RepID=B1KPK3_SHEWM|nr:uroporphyrinogen-III C-methyltransferase [Shewanella woodyi]ACA86156.1 uroporphyrin-III C-methyltransferase [Shewanella woodyi ATCC 51908]